MEKIIRKSLLYKSEVEYADFCMNYIEGCTHGCKFPCYAMNLAKRFGKIKSYNEWIKPKIVRNTLELIDKEIPKFKNQIKFVHLCFMTDPFMYREKEVQTLTLKVIAKLNHYGVKCTLLTKGIYPKILTDSKIFSDKNEYGITLVSLNDDFKKQFEPYSAPYDKRIASLKMLHEKELKTWVSIEPYPTPNLDKRQNLFKLLEKIKFVDKIIFGKLNYNTMSSNFKDNDIFYNYCANEIIEFCRQNNILHHIKFGTQPLYNKRTENVFSNRTYEPLITV